MPKISVIIPCYNQGIYIDEAVESVLVQSYQNFEIIIVDDGSTDEETKKKLMEYDKPKTRVIHTTNQGLASARNNGIIEAKGEYILPLDADDKIGDKYLEEAVNILDQNQQIGICYCLAELFGEEKGKWELPAYSIEKILIVNMIFCTAFFRKKDWEHVGGYKSNMKNGWEDWDFWLSIIELARDVYRIPEVLFFYRIKKNSMLRSMSKEKKIELLTQLFHNHSSLYINNIYVIFEAILDDEDISHIKNSFSYKIGRLVTSPARICKKLIRKIRS